MNIREERTTMKSLFTSALLVAGVTLVGCKTTESAAPPPSAAAAQQSAAGQPTSDSDRFNDGVRKFDAGQYDAAEKVFQALVDKNPKMVNAQFNLGVIAERRGDLARAIAAYEKAHQMDPSHEPTLLNLGKCYRLQDRFEQAIALYEAALKQPGKEYDVQLLNNLAVVYRLAKKFDLAEGAARKVLSRTKDNADAYKNLALIYFDQGNYKLAEFISANARKLDEKDPGVYNNLGMIYLKMDDRRRALAQFQKAVSLSDRFAPGHMNLGAMALSYRDYETAEKSFARAVELEPNSYEVHLGYAYALDGLKGRDTKKGMAAGAAFEKVLALKSGHSEAICGAGWAYAADRGGWDKAVGFLERCKSQSISTPTDQQLIDAKIKSIAAMQKAGTPQPAAAQPKEKPKQSKDGAALLDKVSDQAAQEEGALAPAEGASTGTEGQPATSPETEKK